MVRRGSTVRVRQRACEKRPNLAGPCFQFRRCLPAGRHKFGALLDGIPEAFILGISFALGGSVSVAFVAAIFVSNIPQGIAGTTSLRAAGYSEQKIVRMWTTLTVACAVTAALGYLLAHHLPAEGLYSEAFAAGAVLTMLADSMMPEAFEHGGKTVGLFTVLGYLVAAVLSVAQ
jgi:ZIP family zinc transporter